MYSLVTLLSLISVVSTFVFAKPMFGGHGNVWVKGSSITDRHAKLARRTSATPHWVNLRCLCSKRRIFSLKSHSRSHIGTVGSTMSMAHPILPFSRSVSFVFSCHYFPDLSVISVRDLTFCKNEVRAADRTPLIFIIFQKPGVFNGNR